MPEIRATDPSIGYRKPMRHSPIADRTTVADRIQDESSDCDRRDKQRDLGQVVA